MNPALASHLWQSTWFAVAVGLLSLLFRRNRARVRFALWLCASIKFLVPFAPLIDSARQLAPPAPAPVIAERLALTWPSRWDLSPVPPHLCHSRPQAGSRPRSCRSGPGGWRRSRSCVCADGGGFARRSAPAVRWISKQRYQCAPPRDCWSPEWSEYCVPSC